MLPALAQGVGFLEGIELHRAKVELIRSTGTSRTTHRSLDKLYVRVLGTESEGWGELATLDEPVGTDPATWAVAEHLERFWFDRLFETAGTQEGRCPASQAVGLLSGGAPVAVLGAASIEMAILDAELRASKQSLTSWLGHGQSDVAFGGLVGIPEDRSVAVVIDQAAELLSSGISRLRLKVMPGFAHAPLAALRGLAPTLALQADANGAFRLEDVDELRSLDELGLACLEQPLPSGDLAASALLASQLETPLCLDESITSLRAAADALRYDAARVLCVKPGRLGGLRTALSVLRLAAEQGASAFVGGMFETGLGRAFLASLAAVPGANFVSDVVAPSTYLLEDPCGLEGPQGDRQGLWGSPGVGPWPAAGSLELVAQRRL